MGNVDKEGDLTGSNVAYIYPDQYTALAGKFEKGRMLGARETRLEAVEVEGDIARPVFREAKGPAFRYVFTMFDEMGKYYPIQYRYVQ